MTDTPIEVQNKGNPSVKGLSPLMLASYLYLSHIFVFYLSVFIVKIVVSEEDDN